MRSCSVIKKLRIVRGGFEDYKKLARFHYRDNRPGAYTAIFVIKSVRGGVNPALQKQKMEYRTQNAEHRTQNVMSWWGSPTSPSYGETRDPTLRLGEPVGVIVYTMPSMGVELRDAATGGFFSGFDNRTRMALINKNIRCISRVIIEPRFRGLGLASRLVRETMPEMGVPIVEAMAVMGLVNPFFEKAGMTAFTAKMPVRCVQLVEAFSTVGIEKEELIDAEKVQRKLEQLGRQEAEFIESEIGRFLQSYGKRRYEKPGVKRTRFILSKLTDRPVYYIWLNKNLELRI